MWFTFFTVAEGMEYVRKVRAQVMRFIVHAAANGERPRRGGPCWRHGVRGLMSLHINEIKLSPLSEELNFRVLIYFFWRERKVTSISSFYIISYIK